MNKQIHQQTLALAAMFQSVHLVYQIAVSGKHNLEATESLLSSLFILDADSTEDIFTYNNKLLSDNNKEISLPVTLQLGLSTLRDILLKKHQAYNKMLISYVISLIKVEKELTQRQDILDMLTTELKVIIGNLHNYKYYANPSLYAQLSNVYVNTLGKLSYRVHINGKKEFLQQAGNANMIRSLLFCGIRATILWRQVSGSRWQLLLGTKKILKATSEILNVDK